MPAKKTKKLAARKAAKPVKKKPVKKKPVKKKAAAKTPTANTSAAGGAPETAPYSEGKWSAALAPRSPGEKRYWLVKSEPETFSFGDLLRAPHRTTCWDGVRNFAARNFLRDGMRLGDRVFFYHSLAGAQAIVGICEVVREGYPDHTALDPEHAHHDPGSNPDAPQWYMVDMRAVAQFTRPVTLEEIKTRKELSEMTLLRIGRLSVTPVTAREWEVIVGMAA
ncbi:MAG TPA: EVE domain-containing protein [Gemmatimonadaceae bacterium]|nr:EVE domain-containing protein [Gemmatimonadaceae bacterium]